MLDLFLPFIIGLALGIEPAPATDTELSETVENTVQPVVADTGSGDDHSESQAPEPQIPTGKFTTAIEVRPILDATKANWVGVREFDGQDLVYFSHLLAWRCGLWDIRYGVNGAPAETGIAMEPCNDEFAQPNVMLDVENFPPYVTYPLNSVESITVEVVFDDGTVESMQFDRNDVRIP